jgi:HSP20 family protein
MATRQSQSQEVQRAEAPVPAGTERTRTRRVYAPRTDIYETDEALILVADMPGVLPDGLDITLEGRQLTVRGRAGEYTPAGYSPVYLEYGPGDYERSFVLSEEIDAERLEARLRDGVLHLTLPKAPTAQARRIQVRTS